MGYNVESRREHTTKRNNLVSQGDQNCTAAERGVWGNNSADIDFGTAICIQNLFVNLKTIASALHYLSRVKGESHTLLQHTGVHLVQSVMAEAVVPAHS